jgi:NAD-dependent deacetylase
MPASLEHLRERLARASRITVLTGAGVSAASGVPTFRGADGLWRTHRAENLATPEACQCNPTLVWEWYDWRRTLMAGCQPNAAHEVLARWTHERGAALITQNVDGLHELAGSRDVVRFHGSIWMLRCVHGCGRPDWEDRTAPLPSLPPLCPSCGGLARPAVTWFGEIIDPRVLERCAVAVDCELFLSVGTSALVYPAAGLLYEAHRRGAFTVEINPHATDASDLVDLAIALPAERALPLL